MSLHKTLPFQTVQDSMTDFQEGLIDLLTLSRTRNMSKNITSGKNIEFSPKMCGFEVITFQKTPGTLRVLRRLTRKLQVKATLELKIGMNDLGEHFSKESSLI